MRTPSSALPIDEALSNRFRLLLANRALRVEFADAAALGAGRRVDHHVDEGWPAGLHGLVHGSAQLVRRGHMNADATECFHHLVVTRVFDEDGCRDVRTA